MYQRTAASSHRRSRGRRQERSGLSLFRTLIIILCIFILLTFIHLGVSGESVVEATTTSSELKYRVVEISSGDTLWTIAKANYSPEFKDVASYVCEIKRCNHITGSKIIPGNKLTVPYYE